MTRLTDILDAPARQLSIEELLAALDAENRDDAPPESVATDGILTRPDVIRGIEDLNSGTVPHNGLEPGASVGHVGFADFRGVYVGPGQRPGQAKVRVTAGWRGGSPPAWPVSVPYSKLTEV